MYGLGLMKATYSRPGGVLYPGDTWGVEFQGEAPDTFVYGVGGKDLGGCTPGYGCTQTYGMTDGSGNLQLGHWVTADDAGNWGIQYAVGDLAYPIGSISFRASPDVAPASAPAPSPVSYSYPSRLTPPATLPVAVSPDPPAPVVTPAATLPTTVTPPPSVAASLQTALNNLFGSPAPAAAPTPAPAGAAPVAAASGFSMSDVPWWAWAGGAVALLALGGGRGR